MNWIRGLAAVGVMTALAGCKPAGPAQMQLPPPEVVVQAVSPQKLTLTTELPGRTSGFRVADIRPQVTGIIQKRLFTEGADVKAGDVLYQIDPAPFQAALESAQANLLAAKQGADRARAAVAASEAGVERQKATVELARTNRKRFEDLFKDKAVSASERDQAVTEADVAEAAVRAAEAQVSSDKAAVAVAEAAIQQAAAALETAKINLGYTHITAPIAGRIGRSNVTEGALATAYQTVLATIQEFDPIYVDVPQSTAALSRLRRNLEKGGLKHSESENNEVRLLLEDGTPYAHAAALKFRDVSVDPTTGSVILRIVAPNPERLLLPGMFVRAIIEEGVNENAILIPQQAVSRDTKGNPQALVVNNKDVVELRSLTVDRAVGDQWLVSSGLSAGERVIIEGVQKVRPGATVKVVTPAAATAPAK